MFEIFLQPASWIAIATLTLLEIVLGIDNIVFIAILSARLPREKQKTAQQLGLAVALATRLALLFATSWITGLEHPLFTVGGFGVSGRALILLGGGLFLIVKSTREIYEKTEMVEEHGAKAVAATMGAVIVQIALMDMIFSLDSIVTAVGMVNELPLMVAGVVLAMVVMVVFANRVSEFINDHPSLKILALAFLLLIGVLLVAEGMGRSFPRGYVYFAMAFALGVDLLQMRYEANTARRRSEK